MRGKRPRDADHDTDKAARDDSNGVAATAASTSSCSFGQYVWCDVGIILYARLALLLHDTCARCARVRARRVQADTDSSDSSSSSSDDDDGNSTETSASTVARRVAVLAQLERDMQVAWHVARVHLADAAERHAHDARVRVYATRLFAALRDAVMQHGATKSNDNDNDNKDNNDNNNSGGSRCDDELTLCRRLLRVLEQHGFGDADCVGGMCSVGSGRCGRRRRRARLCYGSALLRRLHELRQRRASRVGYAYSERATMVLPAPCSAVDGNNNGNNNGRRAGDDTTAVADDDDDNRAGDDKPDVNRTCGGNRTTTVTVSTPVAAAIATTATTTSSTTVTRAGYVVRLPLPHPHPEVNTAVQLAEPRRRRTALDEYRVFAHPKKAAAFAVDDFLVDEELQHRAYVVLCHHLDTYGSLHGVSPYVRVTLWRLLDHDTATLLRLCFADAATARSGDAVEGSATAPTHVKGEHDTSSQQQQQQPQQKEAAPSRAPHVDDDSCLAAADAALRLCRLRSVLERKLRACEAARVACRRGAQQVSWYAMSAQWRDNALAAMDAHDWYALRDTLRLSTTTSRYTLSATNTRNSSSSKGRSGGGAGGFVAVVVNNSSSNRNGSGNSSGSGSGSGGVAIFPNYARAPAVRALALALLRKLDGYYDHPAAAAAAATTADARRSATPSATADDKRDTNNTNDGASHERCSRRSAASASSSREHSGSAATATRRGSARVRTRATSAAEARPGSVHEMVLRVLLPLLTGDVPTLTSSCLALHNNNSSNNHHRSSCDDTSNRTSSSSSSGGASAAASLSWRRQQARLHAFFDGHHVTVQRYARRLAQSAAATAATRQDNSSDSSDDSDDDDDSDGAAACVYSFVCPSVVLALQSLAELLELCSLTHYSAVGLDVFARRLLVASWHDERTLLTFVLRREPTNMALATFAGGVMRVYAELSAAVRQLVTRERLLAALIEARRLAAHSALVDLRRGRARGCYVYGTALASVFADEGRTDELYLLRVQRSNPLTRRQQRQRRRGGHDDDSNDSDDSDDSDSRRYSGSDKERERWCNEAALERAPAVWPEELQELLDDEAAYRAAHTDA